jgi:predicted dehydrogenase
MSPLLQASPSERLTGVPVAVVGVGEHGRSHARELKTVTGAELVGVYDLRGERAREVAGEMGVRAFKSLDETLEAVRAVSVVIPTIDHASVAQRAFERGVDVLLEKPITLTLEEADELIRSAEARGRILQVGHIERFNPGVVAARAIMRQPLFFEIHRLGVFSPRSLDVDVVFDLMIHDLDLLLWMVPAPVADVHAVGLAVLSDRVDIANARVEFQNGTVANLTASRVSTEKVRKFRFFQPHEYISIDFSRRDALVLSVEHDGSAPRLGFRKLETPPTDPLRAELAEFIECVRTRRAPQVGGSEGRQALQLAARVMACIEEHAARLHISLARAVGSAGEF